MNKNTQSTKTTINGHNWLRNKSLKDLRNEIQYIEEIVISDLLSKFPTIFRKYGSESKEYENHQKLYNSIVSEIVTKIDSHNKVSPTRYTPSESFGFTPHYMDLVVAA